MTEKQCKSLCMPFIDDRYGLLSFELKSLLKWVVDQARTPMQLMLCLRG